jgi:hypothetical protein
MEQKFKKYDFVRVKEYDECFALFGMEFYAIVEYTYFEKYGGGQENRKDYSLFILKGDKIISNAAWYDEDQLTFVRRSLVSAKRLIKKYEETIENDED